MAELDKEVSQAAQDAKPDAAPQVTPDGKLEGVTAAAQEATAALRALVDRVRPFVRVPAVPDVVPGAYDEVEGLKAPLIAADGAAALAEALAATAGVATADRALGCVVGMCVGDAVGAPLEFSQCCDGGQDKGLRWVAATNSYPGGEVNNFGLKRGQWTDDASMGLALADSLLATGGFDGADARIRWHLWWARGYANAFKYDGDGSKRSVGLGGNISRSLGALEPGVRPPPAYEAPREDAGNGSVMRLGAVPVRYFRDFQGLTRAATGSSHATHPGALAAECCDFLAAVCAGAIAHDDAAQGYAIADRPARWLEEYAAAFEEQDIELSAMRDFIRKRGRAAMHVMLEQLGIASAFLLLTSYLLPLTS